MKKVKVVVLIHLAIAMTIFLASVLGRSASNYVKDRYVLIPKADAPGHTFELDSVTYQVRPIKMKRKLRWDCKADSIYKSYMEIKNGKEKRNPTLQTPQRKAFNG